jgi:hypothetical protein
MKYDSMIRDSDGENMKWVKGACAVPVDDSGRQRQWNFLAANCSKAYITECMIMRFNEYSMFETNGTLRLTMEMSVSTYVEAVVIVEYLFSLCRRQYAPSIIQANAVTYLWNILMKPSTRSNAASCARNGIDGVKV